METMKFLFGTPQRFVMTMLVVAMLATVSKIWPGLIYSSLNQLAQELNPLLQVGLMLIIMGIGLTIIVRGLRK